VEPHHVRLRTTAPIPGTPLFELLESGEFAPLSEEGTVREIRRFLVGLEGATLRLESDHTLNLLMDLKKSFGLTYIFVAHDLSVVRHVSTRVAVMYLGKVVEVAPAEVFDQPPRHPYTEALLAAAPLADPHRPMKPPPVKGDVASPVNPPSGCRFRTRCPEARQVCIDREPPLKEIGPGHRCACHFR
jgi:oligopeptide/dipeptide ABC transporter ATP-binding protein